MWHVGGEVHIGFWWENVRERYCLEDLGIDEVIILKQFLRNWLGGRRLD
jgi:hypothetical protein